jgi:hypothetical protein
MRFRYGAAIVLALVSAAFALDGQIGIHDRSTIIPCDGKYYTFGTGGGGLISNFCAHFLDKDDAPVKNFLVNLGEAAK